MSHRGKLPENFYCLKKVKHIPPKDSFFSLHCLHKDVIKQFSLEDRRSRELDFAVLSWVALTKNSFYKPRNELLASVNSFEKSIQAPVRVCQFGNWSFSWWIFRPSEEIAVKLVREQYLIVLQKLYKYMECKL